MPPWATATSTWRRWWVPRLPATLPPALANPWHSSAAACTRRPTVVVRSSSRCWARATRSGATLCVSRCTCRTWASRRWRPSSRRQTTSFRSAAALRWPRRSSGAPSCACPRPCRLRASLCIRTACLMLALAWRRAPAGRPAVAICLAAGGPGTALQRRRLCGLRHPSPRSSKRSLRPPAASRARQPRASGTLAHGRLHGTAATPEVTRALGAQLLLTLSVRTPWRTAP
mmetsp:Transcript_3524/g.10933  ORF Transcript_3524/g.10933 Transcript_3524/m.10933 type:complete len:229 (+) Transcript_3524:236-922(+)